MKSIFLFVAMLGVFPSISRADMNWATTNGLGDQVEGIITDVVVGITFGEPSVIVTIGNDKGIASITYNKQHLTLGNAAAAGIGKKALGLNLGNGEVHLIFKN